MKEQRIVFPEMGRTEEYRNWLQRILDSGNCPFCEEHWPGEHQLPFETREYWILTENAVKSEKVNHHWLIICRRHITRGDELKDEEKLELFEIYNELIKKHDLEYLTLIMRSGNPGTGSTVAHLHAQIFVSKKEEVNLTRV
jgi:diadenosine tetraphosphate (Ap4A) HIT family hydrolase